MIFTLLLLIVFHIAFCGIDARAQCPTGSLSFSTQAQLDAFPGAYPGCTSMLFSIDISGTDIKQVNGLTQLTTLSGNLKIHDNPMLTSLSGLGNIASSIGGLDIYNNSVLASLVGLGGITGTGGSLLVDNNSALTNLNGLGSIMSVGGGLGITNNAMLENLTGLSNLNSVAAAFTVSSNVSLTSLDGIEALESVGFTLRVDNNPVLSDINGLSGLNSAGGLISIYSNSVLSSLSGLDNIAPSSISNLNLSANPDLSYCEVASICAYLSTPSNPANVISNSSGCNSRAEIETACMLLPVELLFFVARAEGKDCYLLWRTASEVNGNYFEIEHSRNGVSFETIASIAGNGLAAGNYDYEFVHRPLLSGLQYYRLKLCDPDGSCSYSPVVPFQVSADEPNVYIYPQPVTSGNFQLRFEQTTTLNKILRIYRKDGMLMRKLYLAGTEQEQTIETGGFQSGIYLLHIMDEGGNNSRVLKFCVINHQ